MLLRCTLFRGLRACSGCPTLFDLPCQSRTGIAALTRSYADLVPARQPSTKEATARDGKQRARFSLYSSTTGSFAQSRTWEELYAGHSEVLKSALHVLQQNQGDTEAQRGTEDGHSNQTTSQQTIHRKGADFFWLSVVDPTEEEVKGLCQNLDVHPLTIEDMLNLESRDKMETFSKVRRLPEYGHAHRTLTIAACPSTALSAMHPSTVTVKVPRTCSPTIRTSFSFLPLSSPSIIGPRTMSPLSDKGSKESARRSKQDRSGWRTACWTQSQTNFDRQSSL